MAEYHRIGANKPLRAEERQVQRRDPNTKSESRGVKKPSRPNVLSSPPRESQTPLSNVHLVSNGHQLPDVRLPSIRKEKMATPSKSIEQRNPGKDMYSGAIEIILDGGDDENDIDVLKHMRTIREQNDLRNGKGVSITYVRQITNSEQKPRSLTSMCKYVPYKQGRIYTPVHISSGMISEVVDLLGVPKYKNQLGLDKLKLPEQVPEVEVVLFTGGTREHVGLSITETVNWNSSKVKFVDPVANYMSGIISARGLVPGLVDNCRILDGVVLNETSTCTTSILGTALSNCVTRARANQNLCVITIPIKTNAMSLIDPTSSGSTLQQHLHDLKKLGVFVLMPNVLSVGAYDYQKLVPLSKDSADIYLPGKNVLSLASKELYTVIDGEIPAYAQLTAIIALLTQKLLLDVDEEGNPRYKTRAERYDVIHSLIMEKYSHCPRNGYRIFQIRE